MQRPPVLFSSSFTNSSLWTYQPPLLLNTAARMSIDARSFPALLVFTDPDGSIARIVLIIQASGARGPAIVEALGSSCTEKGTWKKEKEYSKASKSAAANTCGSTTALPLIGGTDRMESIFLRNSADPKNDSSRCI